jgi:hypothetical protein
MSMKAFAFTQPHENSRKGIFVGNSNAIVPHVSWWEQTGAMGGKLAGTLTSACGIPHIMEVAPTFSQPHAREIHSERQNALNDQDNEQAVFHGSLNVWVF